MSVVATYIPMQLILDCGAGSRNVGDQERTRTLVPLSLGRANLVQMEGYTWSGWEARNKCFDQLHSKRWQCCTKVPGKCYAAALADVFVV